MRTILVFLWLIIFQQIIVTFFSFSLQRSERTTRRRARRGQVLVMGDSNFTHRSWKVAPFFSIAGGGATFHDLRRFAGVRPQADVRAVVVGLGINHRPTVALPDVLQVVREGISEVRRLFPDTPIYHLEIPVAKMSNFGNYLSRLNTHIGQVIPQIPHPPVENRALHYSPSERRVVQCAILRHLNDQRV